MLPVRNLEPYETVIFGHYFGEFLPEHFCDIITTRDLDTLQTFRHISLLLVHEMTENSPETVFYLKFVVKVLTKMVPKSRIHRLPVSSLLLCLKHALARHF